MIFISDETLLLCGEFTIFNKKLKYKIMFRIFLILSLLFFGRTCFSQIVTISNGNFLRVSDNTKLIVQNPSVNPIRKTGPLGGIRTISESGNIIVNVGNLTGNFTIPFVSSLGNTINFTYNITSAGSTGGKINFSTYETSDNNLPYPTGVTNVGFNGFDNSSLVIDRFWIIDVNGYSTKPQGTYTFTYDDNDLVGNTINESSLFMQRWNDINNVWGDWLYSPTADIITNTIRLDIANPQDQFKVWTAVDQGQPLPIELISFNCDCYSNEIKWVTASETNNELFILQGTNDGINFINLDTVPGVGNSNQMLYYSTPILDWGYSYFRLRQKDFSGNYENGPIIAGCPKNNIFEPILYPNPNNGKFIISHNSTYTFEVFDLTGRQIWSEISNRTNFDLSDISDGEYIVKMKKNEKIKIFKIQKIN